MKYEVTYQQEVTFLVDDSADTITGSYGDATLQHIFVRRHQDEGAEEYDNFFGLPDWLQHEMDAGRLGELIDSAFAYGFETTGDTA